jgi:hypothetical protein
MSSPVRAAAAAVFATLIACAGARPALADEHIYSYEPASPATRTLTSTGLSFEFEKHVLGGQRVRRIVQTGDRGSAELRPAPESALGAGGLHTALVGTRPVGDLYEIEPAGDGRAFVQAVCPGAKQAWLVIGPLERFRDLKIQAVGRPDGAPAAKPCVTLEFVFHSEWRLPPDRGPPRARFPVNQP